MGIRSCDANGLRLCKKCLVKKPLSEFYKKRRYDKGKEAWTYSPDCNPCGNHGIDGFKKRRDDPPGFRTCSRCKKLKEISEFAKHKTRGFQGYCKPCEYQRFLDRKKSPEHSRKMRSTLLKCKYGITMEVYDAMLKSQDGACAICGGQNQIDKPLAVDHCHKTGKVRGLLCYQCNVGIGNLRDDPNILRLAIRYIESYTVAS